MVSPGFKVLTLFIVGVLSNASQMHCRHISHNAIPAECPVDPAALIPRLLPGETAQGLLTSTYIPRQSHIEEYRHQAFSAMSLKQLLWVSILPQTTGSDVFFKQEHQLVRFGRNT